MGLFERLKGNIDHSGVTVKVEAPVVVDSASGGFDGKVTLTAEAAATVEHVNIKLERISSGMNVGGSGNMNEQILFQGPISGPLTLQPGVPQDVPFHVPLFDVAASLAKASNPLLQGLGQLAGTLSEMGSHRCYLVAHAKVQGHVLEPADKMQMNISHQT